MTGSPTEPEDVAPPGFVLVPVPADMVGLVSQEMIRLQWQTDGVARAWEPDALIELLTRADDLVTTVVRTAARSELDARVLVDDELAEYLGVGTRELAGIVHEINDSSAPGTLDLVVLHRVHHDDGTVVREVRMMREHARRVEEAVPIARRRRLR